MNHKEIINYALSKPGATEDYPFGEDVLVVKIAGKMFLLISIKDGLTHVNLKCDPELALVLRQQYDSVIEGYHMNKKHWNTVIIDDSIPNKEIKEMIDHSYDLVFSKLRKKEQNFLINKN